MEEEGQVQWEYMTADTPSGYGSDDNLNKYGKEGWEAYAANGNRSQVLLKRKVVRPKQKSNDYDYSR